MNFRSPLNLALVACVLVLAVAGYLLVPAGLELPVRWGLDGAVTSTMPRNFALLQMPVATLIVWGLVYLVASRGTAMTRPSTATALRIALPVLTALFALVALVILLTGLGVAVPFFRAA